MEEWPVIRPEHFPITFYVRDVMPHFWSGGYYWNQMAALTAGQKLRIKFRKALRKHPTTNAELDPAAPLPVRLMLKSEEVLVVKVTRTNGGHYWFTDRRLIGQGGTEFLELLKY